MSKIDEEKRELDFMIRIYCRKNHDNKNLCNECKELREYAFIRLEHCRYGKNKSSCNKCPTPCYKKEKREQIRNVMRFSGPRMIFYHPAIAIKHLLSDLASTKKH